MRVGAIVLLAYLFFSSFVMATKPIKVVFINPGVSDKDNPSGSFWISVSDFMRAVANDFNFDLEILYAERNHIKMLAYTKEILKREPPPDYLVTGNEKKVAGKIIELTEKSGIRVFLFNNGLTKDQQEEYGTPRSKYKHWIGALLPDQIGAGANVAKQVINAALSNETYTEKFPLQVFGITGDASTFSSVQREKGLREVINAYPNVILKQIVIGDWRLDKAQYQFKKALKRYPDIGAVWSANDPMGLGAMRASISAGRKPGRDIFFGGINWNEEALHAVKSNLFVTSVGGHFMDGGWSLIMLYDYHHGIDFDRNPILQPLSEITLDNVSLYIEHMEKSSWNKIDFTQFSKKLNPNIKQYDFNIDAIFRTLGVKQMAN